MFVEHHSCINFESVTMTNDALSTPSTLGKCEST